MGAFIRWADPRGGERRVYLLDIHWRGTQLLCTGTVQCGDRATFI